MNKYTFKKWHQGILKAYACANRSTQREYFEKEDTTSPTALNESVLITVIIEAKQKRDVMTVDVLNTFIQTDLPIN